MKKRIIDFHTHAFPEKIVDRAIASLEENCGEKAWHDGRISSLLQSMDVAGIYRAVIANIATNPDQFLPIVHWSKEIRSERIIPFLSIHPEDPKALEHIRQVKAEGFLGIKMHPYYQQFILDEERMFPLYEEMVKQELLLLSHTGFDIAFPHDRICDPEKIAHVVARFPDLQFVASHCGAWEDWDEVEKHLLGKNIFMELSFSDTAFSQEKLKQFISLHPGQYLLFGTDSPWVDQKATLDGLRHCGIGQDVLNKILFENAERLLHIA